MAGKSAPSAPKRKPGSKPAKKAKARTQSNLLSQLVLVIPVLVFYELGVLSLDRLNGADFITVQLLKWLGRTGFIWVNLGILAAVIGVAFYLRKKQELNLKIIAPVLIESVVYAAVMGTTIIFLMVDVLGIDPRLASGDANMPGIFGRLVISAGAGFHEELLFRLILLSGLHLAGTKWLKWKPWLAGLVAILVSSVLFSLAHHVGALGEPLKLGVFAYRTIAGILFATIFLFRGFATAVYTHFFYDVYVLVFRA